MSISRNIHLKNLKGCYGGYIKIGYRKTAMTGRVWWQKLGMQTSTPRYVLKKVIGDYLTTA